MAESVRKNLLVAKGEILTSFIFVAHFSSCLFFFNNTHTDGSALHVLVILILMVVFFMF